MIESSQNKIIKEIKSLSEKKYRDRTNTFIADGLRFVSEIPESMKVEKMIFSDGFAAKNDISRYMKRCECYVVSDRLFKEISETENPQGIMAVCEKINFDAEEIIKDYYLTNK